MNIYGWQLQLRWRDRDLSANVLVAAQSLIEARQAAVEECPHYLSTFDIPLEDVSQIQEDMSRQMLEVMPSVQNDKTTYVFYVHGSQQLSWLGSSNKASSKVVS